MLNVLLLCCGLLQGIQAVLAADLSRSHLQKASGGLEGVDRAHYPGLLRKVKEVAVEPAGEFCALPDLLLPPTSKIEVGIPYPGSDAGDSLKAALFLLSL